MPISQSINTFKSVKIDKIAGLLDGKLLLVSVEELNFTHAFSSDLMSDVLRWHEEKMILVTGLATVQTIRTAEMSAIRCIVFARGKNVTDEMLELAQESDISIIISPKSMFEISGILYSEGIQPLF